MLVDQVFKMTAYCIYSTALQLPILRVSHRQFQIYSWSCDCSWSESLLNVLQSVPLLDSTLFIDRRDQSHNQATHLNLAVTKSTKPVSVAAVGVNPVNRLRCHF